MPSRRRGLLTMELDGPFFTADPVKTYRRNVRDLMDKMAQVAAAEVRAGLRPSAEATSSGKAIRGRTRSLRTGERWASYMVVSAVNRANTGAQERRIMAELSGRRVAVRQRAFTPRGERMIGQPIGTTRGAEARRAFKQAATAMRRVIRDGNLTEGL